MNEIEEARMIPTLPTRRAAPERPLHRPAAASQRALSPSDKVRSDPEGLAALLRARDAMRRAAERAAERDALRG